MKLFKFLLLILCFCSGLRGEIIESDRFESIFPYAQNQTLVLIDLDNTLFESELMLGSAPWRRYFLHKVEDLKLENPEKLLATYWDFLQNIIPVRLVDPNSANVIDQLRRRDIVVLGFTARAKREVPHTIQQLEKLGVFFTPLSADIFPHQEKEGTLTNGVVFCGDYTKSECLHFLMKNFSRFNRPSPSAIVIVDDRLDQVTAVGEAAKKYGIPFVGIRFTGTDARTAEFNPRVVEMQWVHLPVLVPDYELIKR